MQFGILGSLVVSDGDRQIEFARPKQRAVLVALLLGANYVVSPEVLMDFLWGGDPPAWARGALQVHVSGVRAALEPDQPARMRTRYVVTHSHGYLLRVGPDDLDAARFERLATEGQELLAAGHPAAARVALAKGLSLWRGAALAEFASEPLAQSTIARLHLRRMAAVEDRIDADLALGNHAAVTAELEVLVDDCPLRERLWGQLMLALYRCERQSEALRTFTRARSLLREVMGIEPGPPLRRLEGEILRQEPSLDWRPPADEGGPIVVSTAAAAAPAPRPTGAGSAGGPAPVNPTVPAKPVMPMVGREEELATLGRSLGDVLAGRGAVAMVSGEPGAGKTRLVEELTAQASKAGVTVLWGRCHDGPGAPTCWPWVQVIRDVLSSVDVDTVRAALASRAAEIAQIASEVKDWIPNLESPPTADLAAARFRLYEAVHGFVAAVAARQPVAIVLEDLHWADAASLQLVEFVAGHLAATGVLLIVTFRDLDPAICGPLAETLGVLAQLRSLYRAQLAGLSPAECSAFIATTFGVVPSPAVMASIHTRTGGNPFYLRELGRQLARQGDLAAEELSPAAIAVPPSVRDVVRRRLGRLPARTTDLLVAAAVLGPEVDLQLVCAVAQIDEDEAVDLLDAAVALGILVEDRTIAGRFRFAQALVHETVLADIGPARHAKLHARAAAALRAAAGDDDDAYAVPIAEHLYRATPVVRVEDALTGLLRAADVSHRRLAYELAQVQLRRALELVGRMPLSSERSHGELDVQYRLATLLTSTEGYQSTAVAEAWVRAHELCLELGDTPAVMETLWGLGRLARTRAEFSVSTGFGEQLLQLSVRSRDLRFAIAGHECIGQPALYTGDFATAADHLTKAVTAADEAMLDPDATWQLFYPAATCRGYLACVYWMLGDSDRAERVSAEACRLADESGHTLSRAVTRLYRAKLMALRGDPEEAQVQAQECLLLGRSEPLGALELVADVVDSWSRAMLSGDEHHVAALAATVAALKAAGWRLASTYFHVLQADAYRAVGQLDLAQGALDAGLKIAAATGEVYCQAELYRLAGELCLVRSPGTVAEAERWFRRAIVTAERQGAVPWLARAESSLAAIAELAR